MARRPKLTEHQRHIVSYNDGNYIFDEVDNVINLTNIDNRRDVITASQASNPDIYRNIKNNAQSTNRTFDLRYKDSYFEELENKQRFDKNLEASKKNYVNPNDLDDLMLSDLQNENFDDILEPKTAQSQPKNTPKANNKNTVYSGDLPPVSNPVDDALQKGVFIDDDPGNHGDLFNNKTKITDSLNLPTSNEGSKITNIETLAGERSAKLFGKAKSIGASAFKVVGATIAAGAVVDALLDHGEKSRAKKLERIQSHQLEERKKQEEKNRLKSYRELVNPENYYGLNQSVFEKRSGHSNTWGGTKY